MSTSSSGFAGEVGAEHGLFLEAEEGPCHRLVYDPDGEPTDRRAHPVAFGWPQDH